MAGLAMHINKTRGSLNVEILVVLKTMYFYYVLAKAEITDEKLEELLEQGSYGAIFNGDVSIEAKDNGSLIDLVIQCSDSS